jgi:hypothetical protein
MTGDGPLSYIRNRQVPLYTPPGAKAAQYTPVLEQLGCVFRLGGVEGASPYWINDEDPRFALSGVKAGQGYVDLDAKPTQPGKVLGQVTWKPGDVVYLRTDEADAGFSEKPIPLEFEINEVVGVGPTVPAAAGRIRVTLKYAARNDYVNGSILLHGLRDDECNPGTNSPNPCFGHGTVDSHLRLKIESIKRFRLRNMKLDASHPLGPPVLGYGGCFECEFTDLWVDDSGEFMQLNAMARCRFENIRARLSRGFGELAYYSHDNTFRSLHVTQYVSSDATIPPRNGINLTEQAGDNLLEDVHLDFNGPGYPVVVSGRNNRFVNCTFHAGGPSLAVVLLAAAGLQYKPRFCTLENVTVHMGSQLPRFGVLIDSGGKYGGFNTVRGLIVVGRPMVAAVGFARFDILLKGPSATPCENNLVDGVTQVYAGQGGQRAIPDTGTVVEYNNLAPDAGGQERIIDPAYAWGSNVVINSRTSTTQRSERRIGPGRATAGAPLALRYVVPAMSAGTHTFWTVSAAGHIDPRMTGGAKTILLRLGETAICSIQFAAAETGSWRIEATVGGTLPSTSPFPSSMLVMQNQRVVWTVEKNGASLHGTAGTEIDLNASDLVIAVEATSQGADAVDVDLWSVVPAGDQVGLINWELLKDVFGAYPLIGTP